ncbi:MAG: hypothetical protein JNJ83_02360 [Verrucomicrobiaceae bacterium]|nr:hypothetical protein [Verrucomicrobiaceae bacterium]
MTLLSSIFRGAVGFSLVSLASFSVWAFASGWFKGRGGELGMYAGCALVFFVGTGLALSPLLQGPRARKRFNAAFLTAFAIYAVVWTVAWMALGFPYGEWVASGAGSLAFAITTAAFLGGWSKLPVATVLLFFFHSAGYFTGAQIYYTSEHGTAVKLLWGVLYGLGFGAGIGQLYYLLQSTGPNKPS